MVDFLIELLFFFGIIAIVAVNIFLVRIVIIIVRYRKWRQFAVPAVGTVGELIDINGIFNRRNTVTSYRYNYALKIICGNQEFDSIYSEVCKPDSYLACSAIVAVSDHKDECFFVLLSVCVAFHRFVPP